MDRAEQYLGDTSRHPYLCSSSGTRAMPLNKPQCEIYYLSSYFCYAGSLWLCVPAQRSVNLMQRVFTSRLVLLSFLFVLFSRSSVISQTMQPGSELLPQLDALAGGADSPTGRASYTSLVMTLSGADKLYAPFPSAFTKRFMLAEERVRKGKQERVSELAISMAFNRLAEIIKSPARADVDAIHQVRTTLADKAPHLITVKVSPTSCYPGEALILIYLLVANDGLISKVPSRVPKGTELASVHVAVTTGNQKSMTSLISDFVNGHSQMDVLTRVERVLSLLNL